MMYRTLSCTAAIFFTAAAAWATEPSFDCSRADASAEELICSDDTLAALDREVARLYRLATQGEYATAERNRELKAYQRGWIKGRNDCWKADDLRQCVRDEMVIRIAELRQGYANARSADGQGISTGPLALACDGFDAGIGVTFVATDPPLAQFAWRDTNFVAELQPGGSCARYAGSNFAGTLEVWIKGEEAMATLPDGRQLTCRIEEIG